jgi:hypothetical protein
LVLTDFQFKPVRLLVPMFITLEIEPVFWFHQNDN